ncbi:hypothetical protein [Sanyastnella coralliicola]|uniref:hypothetical protein n=1 Tax=Sanyastnella coralliicola TaxID=3069118 RepID=UPI0027B96AA1|nr:hypothetical protein [Longitalea sp. SCSIO 12813]
MNDILDSHEIEPTNELVKQFTQKTRKNAFTSVFACLFCLFIFVVAVEDKASIVEGVKKLFDLRWILPLCVMLFTIFKASKTIGSKIALRRINPFLGFFGILYLAFFATFVTACISQMIWEKLMYTILISNESMFMGAFIISNLIILIPGLFVGIIYGADLRITRDELFPPSEQKI